MWLGFETTLGARVARRPRLTRTGLPGITLLSEENTKCSERDLLTSDGRDLRIDRSDGTRAMETIQEGVAQLPDGTGVLFFPEGTRSWTDEMLPFKKGAFIAARNSGLPILPVTVNGSRRLLPKGSAVFHSGTIEVIIHPPISSDDSEEEQIENLMEHTRRIIAGARSTGTSD